MEGCVDLIVIVIIMMDIVIFLILIHLIKFNFFNKNIFYI